MSDPLKDARERYDDLQREIGFDPGDPRLLADGTLRMADQRWDELVAHLRKFHFQECADLLDEYARTVSSVDRQDGVQEAASFLRALDGFPPKG